MTKNIKISVLIATYNGSKYIEQQIHSIFNQTILPDELIICDDNSSDETVKMVNKVFKNKNKKISCKLYSNNNNLGYIKNFSKVLSLSKGEYIFLCDQDDIWEKNKIEKMISIMRKNDCELLCTGFKLIDSFGNDINDIKIYAKSPLYGYEKWTKKIYDVKLEKLIWGNFSPGCTYCIKRDIINIYDKLNCGFLSHDFQLMMIAASLDKCLYLDFPLIKYRIHNSNAIGMNCKDKRQKNNFIPRVYKFLLKLNKVIKIKNLTMIGIILFLRLPAIRFFIVKKFNLKNNFFK